MASRVALPVSLFHQRDQTPEHPFFPTITPSPSILPLPPPRYHHSPSLPTTTTPPPLYPPPPPNQRLCPTMGLSLLAPALLSLSPGYQGLLIPAWLGQEGELPLHRLVERNGAPREARTPPTWPGLPASFTSRSCLSSWRFSTWKLSPAETRPPNCRISSIRATETWLKAVGDEVKLQELIPPGFVEIRGSECCVKVRDSEWCVEVRDSACCVKVRDSECW